MRRKIFTDYLRYAIHNIGSETLREIVEARINKYVSTRKEREITDWIIPTETATEADRLMARNLALQEEDSEA